MAKITNSKQQLSPEHYIFRTGEGKARFIMRENGNDGLGHSMTIEYPFRYGDRKLSRKETIAYCFNRIAEYYPNLTL